MSSATVRNEMSALTDQGYLKQPHTSGGRVPTEDGYRYFVGQLMQDTSLPETIARTIASSSRRCKRPQTLAATGSHGVAKREQLLRRSPPRSGGARIKHIR
jgi:heat-inducible transcriptional repressor